MPIRALVIAIEDYPQAQGLSQSLEGTNDAADAFVTWLEKTKKVPLERICYCGAPGRRGRTAGTTREEILKEVRALVQQGRDQTEELFVFFSGHGFAFTESLGRRPADVLVTSDFTTPDDSGEACIVLREFQEKLQAALGPGDHYYFIDACRNVIPEEEIEPTSLGRRFGTSQLGVGTLFTLYSTAAQFFARAQSGFSQHLVQGLGGQGRAKGWVNDRMYVTFPLLHRYVRSKLPQQEADLRIDGSSEGQIVEITPIPRSKCHVRVRNASAQDSFTVRGRDSRGLSTEERSFHGQGTELELPPGDYFLEVKHPNAPVKQVVPAESVPVDAFDACSVEFEKRPPHPALPVGIPAVLPSMTIRGPAGTALTVRSVAGKSPPFRVPNFPGTVKHSVPPGRYKVELLRPGRRPIQRDITMKEDRDVELDLQEKEPLPAGLMALGLVDSEIPLEHHTPALALSLLGAGRIVSPETLPPRARRLRLHDFSRVKPGESLVYVLAHFARPLSQLHIAAGLSQQPSWREMTPVPGVKGLWQGVLPAPAGPSIFSMHVAPAEHEEKMPPLSAVIHLLPNRATFMTVTEEEGAPLELHQYLLPIRARFQDLPREEYEYLEGAAPRFIRALWKVQHEFARKRTLERSLDPQSREYWHEALYGKWLDPLMALLAGYELLRRRQSSAPSDHSLDLLVGSIGNLRRFYGSIPDVELLAKLAGQPHQEPRSPPLILDGLLAWDFEEPALPLSSSRLTYEGPWVSWRGAVLPPEGPDTDATRASENTASASMKG